LVEFGFAKGINMELSSGHLQIPQLDIRRTNCRPTMAQKRTTDDKLFSKEMAIYR
jgi:hypothetical protein